MSLDDLIADYLKKHTVLQADDVVRYYPDVDANALRERVAQIKTYRKTLKKLLDIPLVKQKSPEWYDMRKGLITASDFAQALGAGKFGTQKQLIEKKCMTTDAPFQSNPFFEWGNLFEQVASDIYSHMHGVRMYEFGLLRHPHHAFFGASPDGISNLGIMLEIKCPLKRKITGEIPTQYYYQIQGQLDVCGLQECDYFECELQRWESYEDYKAQYVPGKYTGVIRVVSHEEGKQTEYSPVQLQQVSKVEVGFAEKVYYWMLVRHSEKRVVKDPVFLTEKMQKLSEVWNKILYYREHAHEFMKDIKQSMDLTTQCLEVGGELETEEKITLGNTCKIVELE